ncbi:hypothetical protein B9C57_10125 [Tenacibaculum maritimum]|nr:hypothetical protein B9C57_10125 [Tenacibaculum maritimum]
MDKGLKKILITINFVVLILCIYWLMSNTKEWHEPVIVFISQLSSILLIGFEPKITNTDIEDIEDGSDIDVYEKNSNKGTSIKRVKNSKIKIRKE